MRKEFLLVPLFVVLFLAVPGQSQTAGRAREQERSNFGAEQILARELFSSLPGQLSQNVQSDQESYCQTISATNSQNASLRSICEFAISLRDKLPKFICEESITRYKFTVGEPEVPLDVIAAEVTFEHGHDSYAKIKLNRKRTGRPMSELSGMSSVGEFGGLLQAIFTPLRATEFEFKKEDKLRSKPALVFAFRVAMRNNKSWWLRLRGTVVFPGYDGVLWLDKSTSQLLRMEVRASEMPTGFPDAEVTTTVDYVDLQFSNGSKFPLPVKSETDIRFHGAPRLFRNKLTFTDCHEFGVTHRVLPGL